MSVPVICPNGHVNIARSIQIERSPVAKLGTVTEPCPQCGQMASSIPGTYSFTNVMTSFQTTSPSDFEAFSAIIKELAAGKITENTAVRRASNINLKAGRAFSKFLKKHGVEVALGTFAAYVALKGIDAQHKDTVAGQQQDWKIAQIQHQDNVAALNKDNPPPPIVLPTPLKQEIIIKPQPQVGIKPAVTKENPIDTPDPTVELPKPSQEVKNEEYPQEGT